MSVPPEFDKGDVVRCEATFKNTAGALIDPSEVWFKVKNPVTGVVTTYSYGIVFPAIGIVRDALGIYHVDVDATDSGTWFYRFYSIGTGQAADEEEFVVKRSQF